MKKVTNKHIYLEMQIPQEESLWRWTMRFPRLSPSSLTNKNYHRDMTGMFKVNKMEGGFADNE